MTWEVAVFIAGLWGAVFAGWMSGYEYGRNAGK